MDPQSHFVIFNIQQALRDAEIERRRAIRERLEEEPGAKPAATRRARRPRRVRRSVPVRFA